MPPTHRETIPCSQCNQPTEVDIWQVLDLAREPDLRRRFLQGEINALNCANCDANGLMGAPLAVHDPTAEQVIFYIPDDPQITPEIMGNIQAELGNALMRNWRGTHPNYLFQPRLLRDLSELAAILAAEDDPLPDVSEASDAPPNELPPELAHLLESNHTPRLWNIIRAQIADTEKAKAWLKENGALLELDI